MLIRAKRADDRIHHYLQGFILPFEPDDGSANVPRTGVSDLLNICGKSVVDLIDQVVHDAAADVRVLLTCDVIFQYCLKVVVQ
jgi:hypothetical protein